MKIVFFYFTEIYQILSSVGAGLVYRNTTDYEQQDAQFKSNVTEFEVRYRRLERELPEFIAQNDRIRDLLQKANDTFLIDTTYQLSMRTIV